MSSSPESELAHVYEEITGLSPERLELFKLLLRQEGLNVSDSLIVPHRNELGTYDLSFAQQRLWFLNQLDPDNCVHNIAVAVRLIGPLRVDALAHSLNEVVRRHEALRATFQAIEGKPTQTIKPFAPAALPLIALDGLALVHREAEAMRVAITEARTPFDLSDGPLVRTTLLRLEKDENILLLTMHHIVSDAWSIGVFVDEVAALYEAFCAGKPSPLAELSLQYTDFTRWQRERLQGEVLEKSLAYWRRQLREPLPALKLPTDYPRPAIPSYRGAQQSLLLSKDLSERLQALSDLEGVTLFMTLLGAFKTLLHRYTAQDDSVVGIGIANRSRIETERLIGFFVNLLVLRIDLSGDPGFRELLRRVRKVTIEAYAHQDMPFDRLVDELQPQREFNRTPLIQAVFVLQNAPFRSLTVPGLTLIPLEVDNGTARFDLTLFMEPTAQGLKARMQYSTDLFNAGAITEMLGRYQTLLSDIVARPELPISRLAFFAHGEKKPQVLSARDRQARAYAKYKEKKPRVISLSESTLIKTSCLESGQRLPLVIAPLFDELDLVEWAASNQEFVERLLLEYGALLFRGFSLASIAEFEQFALALCPALFAENGELERTRISNLVYSPVHYPADKPILWHNENSFCPRWPLKLWFFCVQPPVQGGETPIVDSRLVYQAICPEIREQFEQKGVMYLRNYREGLGLSWQDVFQTHSRVDVEDYCKEFAIDFEWKGADHLTTRSVRPAVVRHPRTGEMVWFNQATHWHVSCLGQAARDSLSVLFREDDLPRNIYYGDGSPIEDSVMDEICESYREIEVVFPWQKGDVLMLDNMLTAHSRRPYSGPRTLAVTMGEMTTDKDL